MTSTGITTTTHNRQLTGGRGVSRQVLGMALLSLAVLVLLPMVALAQQGTLVADVHTTSATPNANHGADDSLKVRLMANGRAHNSYLRFKLTTSLPANATAANVAKATLKLTSPSGDYAIEHNRIKGVLRARYVAAAGYWQRAIRGNV